MAKASSAISQRLRLDLAYDGTDFAGWAKQENQSTVAGTLTQALTVILGPGVADFGLRVAGRTDAGVHAANQVAHIDVTPEQFRRAGRGGLTAPRINGLLPTSIRVKSIAPVSGEFDARFAALQRHYRYRIADSSDYQLPENARFTLWHPKRLDEKLMARAAHELLGMHDFAAFCKPRAGATTIRTLLEASVSRDKAGIVNIALSADAFCHNMVRSIVGALIAIGEGRLVESDLLELLEARARGSRFKVVPPHGLTLIAVDYPPAEQWPQQILKTKNRRDLD